MKGKIIITTIFMTSTLLLSSHTVLSEKQKKPSKQLAQQQKLNSEAIALYKEGKYKEALQKFNQAYQLKPNPVTLYNIARCYHNLGNLPSAMEYYKKYLKSRDKRMRKKVKGHIKKIKEEAKQINLEGVHNYKKGRYKEALSKFKQSYAIDKNKVTLYNIARCYDKMANFRQAYIHYKKYIQTGHKEKQKEAKHMAEKIESMPVLLRVISEPEGAEIYVDGEDKLAGISPTVVEVQHGRHTLLLKMKNYKQVKREIEIPIGGDAEVKVKLEAVVTEKTIPSEMVMAKKETGRSAETTHKEAKPEILPAPLKLEEVKPAKIPLSIGAGAGVTVSTTELIGSFINASIWVYYKIKDFHAGIGVDNYFFQDSYMLAAFPSGGWMLKLPYNLSINFNAGAGAGILKVFKENQSISKDAKWDLIIHADVKLRYKIGAVFLYGIPVCIDFFTSAGNLTETPFAQFIFLLGAGFDFD